MTVAGILAVAGVVGISSVPFEHAVAIRYTLDCRMRRISLSDNGYRTEFLAFFSSAE